MTEDGRRTTLSARPPCEGGRTSEASQEGVGVNEVSRPFDCQTPLAHFVRSSPLKGGRK